MDPGSAQVHAHQGILKYRVDSLQRGSPGGTSSQTSDHLLFAPYVRPEPTPPSSLTSPKTVNFALHPTILSFTEEHAALNPYERTHTINEFSSEDSLDSRIEEDPRTEEDSPSRRNLTSPLPHETWHDSTELATREDLDLSRKRFLGSSRSAHSWEVTTPCRSSEHHTAATVNDSVVSQGLGGSLPPGLSPMRLVRRHKASAEHECNTNADFRMKKRHFLEIPKSNGSRLEFEHEEDAGRRLFKQEEDAGRRALECALPKGVDLLECGSRLPYRRWRNIRSWDLCKPENHADERGKIMQPPKYSMGVLEENWQYRSDESTKPCLPKFKGCSIYKTSYKQPPAESYQDQHGLDAWDYREKMEGLPSELIFASDEKECRNNFLTTTDLAYRILPQICPKMREYNTNLFEWVPSQSFLPCYGNLTHFGLTEEKQREWEAGKVDETEVSYNTTMRDHFQWPHPEDLKGATARTVASPTDPTDQTGTQLQQWHCPKAIVPTLPSGPPFPLSMSPKALEEDNPRSKAFRLLATGLFSRPHLCRVPCV